MFHDGIKEHKAMTIWHEYFKKNASIPAWPYLIRDGG
jgi:hypothetical protein